MERRDSELKKSIFYHYQDGCLDDPNLFYFYSTNHILNTFHHSYTNKVQKSGDLRRRTKVVNNNRLILRYGIDIGVNVHFVLSRPPTIPFYTLFFLVFHDLKQSRILRTSEITYELYSGE